MLTCLAAIGATFGLARIVIEVAAWAASDEPYMKVAPFKRRDMKTLMSMQDCELNLRAMRAHDELRERGGHAGRWGV